MLTTTILKVMRRQEPSETDAGTTYRRMFFPSERYVIDFADDFGSEGWQQFDTDQDAAYFGVWLNPVHRVILTYAEGDWSLEECPTVEHYNDAIGRLCECYGTGRIALCIGADGSAVEYCQDRSEFLKGTDAKPGTIADVLGGGS